MKVTTGMHLYVPAAWVSALRCGFGLLGLFLASCIDLEPEPIPLSYGSITDARDGQVYRTITVEGMTWLQQDLKYEAPGSICPDSTCALRLYSWSTAMGVDSLFDTTLLGSGNGVRQGVCPEGWHVPTTQDWRVFLKIGQYGSCGVNDTGGFGLNGWYSSLNGRQGTYWIDDEMGSGTARVTRFEISYSMEGPGCFMLIEEVVPTPKKTRRGIRCLLDEN